MKNAYVHIDLVFVLVASVAYFALGALWYSKFMFGKYWAKHNGINQGDRSGMARAMVQGFVCTVPIVFATAFIVNLSRCPYWIDCMKVAAVIAICYSYGIIGMMNAYQKKPLGITLVDGTYQALGILMSAAILAKWGMSTGHHGM